jgi:hypothetical protein
MKQIDIYVSYINVTKTNCIQKINLSPTWLVLFILFIGNFLSFIPESNEEQYMQFSKMFYNPEWIPGAFTIDEFAGARILYECIIGFLLNLFSFETVTFVGKLFVCTGYAIIIAGTIKRLNISNFQSVFILQVVFFTFPWFFSGEYLLPGLEPKHFAYLFILTAINKIMDGKYTPSVFLVIGACWFHMLVGGWFFIALMLYFLWTKEVSFTKVCIYSVVCILCLSPLIYYLVNGIILDYHPVKNGLSGNWIYSYIRVPHHTGIFKSMDYFHDHHLKGVLWTAIAMLTSLLVFSSTRVLPFSRLNKFLLTVTTLLLVNVVIAYFDRSGSFVKYYPFRLTPISAYLFYLLGFSLLFTSIKDSVKIMDGFLFISTVVLFLYVSALNIYKNVRLMGNANQSFYDMAHYIKRNTPKNAVIYYADQAEDYRLTFTRVADRDRFFVFKHAPAGTDKIYEWYDRMLLQEKVDKDVLAIFDAKKKYKIDYVLTTDSILSKKIDLVQSLPPYLLYKFE